MPTLTRIIAFLAVIAAIAYGGIYALANFVEPQTRQMQVEIPAAKLNPVPFSPKAQDTPDKPVPTILPNETAADTAPQAGHAGQ
ncbi:MAG: hypothetical protein J0H18_05505 [Rhizobiales bacterium]|nr:hypothetical protein [Hyphomicrobiales bacterium]OJY07013.1 MAG: hypothetical protein BGP07_18695 [Rhizobiales bacterium 63-22]